VTHISIDDAHEESLGRRANVARSEPSTYISCLAASEPEMFAPNNGRPKDEKTYKKLDD
jgi:hypothetical protein